MSVYLALKNNKWSAFRDVYSLLHFILECLMCLICCVHVGLFVAGGWFYRYYLRGPRNHMYRDYYTGVLVVYPTYLQYH